jgi:hypothetical protein
MNASAPNYDERIEAAKRWLGDRYLLAEPINKPKTNRRIVSAKLEDQAPVAARA